MMQNFSSFFFFFESLSLSSNFIREDDFKFFVVFLCVHTTKHTHTQRWDLIGRISSFFLLFLERTNTKEHKRSEFASKKSCCLLLLLFFCFCFSFLSRVPLLLFVVVVVVVVVVDKAKMTVLHATSLRTTRWKESQCCQKDFKNDVLGGRKRKHHVHADASKCEQVHSYLHTSPKSTILERAFLERYWTFMVHTFCPKWLAPN